MARERLPSRVSLAQGKLIIDRPIDIARIVMSRAGGDLSTQVRDTSNILSLYIENPIDETGIYVINDGKCAGTYEMLKLQKIWKIVKYYLSLENRRSIYYT